ncbi:uncharacterized protein LOC143278041 [Babylonia areolata]|uniref:uncharacterized protein LOC143278041 n=1 Tax=Babylonia areolata TaxID=304850 RepID=UPI003FD3E90F
METSETVQVEGFHPLDKVRRYVWYIGPPVVLLFGNFGNVMTVVIMRTLKSGEAVINIYFTALAVLDLVTLDVLFVGEWLGSAFDYHLHYQSNVLCKIHNWTVTTSTSGGWVLVSLTTHRALSVVWPHRVNSLCTRRLVTSLIVGTTTFFAVMYSHFLYGYHLRYFNETGEYMCVMMTGRYQAFVYEVFTYIDLAFYSVLPFTCIIGANCVLVWKLRATVGQLRHQVAERESVAAREKAASSVTLTIVVVSLAYVVLTLPVSVYFVSLFIYDPSAVLTEAERATSELTRAVTFMFMFTNSAVNFYLYCLTGARFRKQFVKMVCPKRSQTALRHASA